jgi:hypothetical protein
MGAGLSPALIASASLTHLPFLLLPLVAVAVAIPLVAAAISVALVAVVDSYWTPARPGGHRSSQRYSRYRLTISRLHGWK